jgi:hypothetical protein
MTRLNVSLKTDLVRDIEEEAEREGKTASSIVSEACRNYIEISSYGLKSHDISKLMLLFKTIKALDAIPVPSLLLDFLIKTSFRSAQQETLERWRERGVVAGNIMIQYAPDIERLKEITESYSSIIPLDFISIGISGENVDIVISGVGYSKESAVCTCEGVVGFLSSYGVTILERESSESFIRISGRISKKA